MLGSVSTKLVQYAPCPVLVVKGEAAPVRRIILATHGSAESTQASVMYVRMPSPLAPVDEIDDPVDQVSGSERGGG